MMKSMTIQNHQKRRDGIGNFFWTGDEKNNFVNQVKACP